MRERFISVKSEQRTGIPERRIAASEPFAEPLARAVRSLPGGEKVPNEAIRDEAEEILEKVKELRNKGRSQSRASFMSILRRRGGQIAAPVALISGIGIGARFAAQTKTGKLLTDTAALADVTRWETKPALEDLPSYEDMRRELEGAIGRELLREEIPVNPADYATYLREWRRERERQAERVSVRLEAGTGLPDARMREIIRETTPPSWTGVHAIESVSVSAGKIPLPKEYGIEGYADGICEHGVSHEPSGIRLSPDYWSKPVQFSLLDHEFAHANDWRRSNTLAPQDRLTLLYLVHTRVSSDERIKFSYVESIKNDDPKQQHLVRIREYWAELMKMALDTPADNEQGWVRKMTYDAGLHDAKPVERGGKKSESGADDVRLVRWYLSVTDPDFRPWNAARARAELVDRTMREAIDDRVREALDGLPPGKIRAIVAKLLERRRADDPEIARNLTRIGRSQFKIRPDKQPRWRVAPDDRTSFYGALLDHENALEAVTLRAPDRSRAVVAAFRDLLETIGLWRTRRDGKTAFDLTDPRQDKEALDAVKRVDALRRALSGLGESEREDAERYVGEFVRALEGDIEQPSSSGRNLVAME